MTARTPIPVVPVGLRVAGRRIVVVGAGRIAARKAAAYVEQGACVIVVAPDHSADMDQVDVDARHRRRFQPSDLDAAWMVVTATGLPEIDGAVFDEAERRRLWCNAADDPDHCSVILPAVSRAGDITVSVSTGGTSPAIASWLRRQIDALLDEHALEIAHRTATVRASVRHAGLPTEVDDWADVLDDARTLVAAGRGAEFETQLFDAVVGGRS